MQFDQLKRRDFIMLLGSAAIAWPLTARAQQPQRMRLIGILMPFNVHDAEGQEYVTALRQELQAFGWTEGRNIKQSKNIPRLCFLTFDPGTLQTIRFDAFFQALRDLGYVDGQTIEPGAAGKGARKAER